jgi:hypothetical protein
MMQSTEFVSLASAQFTVRARRIAYLVQAGSFPDFRKATRYAFTEWGGFGQPIAPVRRKSWIDEGIWQMLDVLKPDVFIDYVGVDPTLRAQIEGRLGSVLVAEANLHHDEPGIHSLVAVPPGSLRARVVLVPGPNASVACQTAVGVLHESPELERLWQSTGATRRTIDGPVDVLDAQLDVPSPLWVSKRETQTYRNGVIGSPVVLYTFARPSLRQLLWFWNIRALSAGTGALVLWLPVGDLSTPGISERLQRECLTKIQSTPDLVLLGDDKAELMRQASAIGFRPETSGKASISISSMGSETRDLVAKPLTAKPMIDPRAFLLDAREYGTRVTVPTTVTRPLTTIQVASPIDFNMTVGGKIRVDVDGISATQWPRRQSVAHLLHSSATWSSSGFGFVTFPSRTFKFDVRLPEAEDVLTQCLRDAGWEWSVSDKGRYARALVGAVPGREAISSLHEPLVLRVIQQLASLTSRKAGQVLAKTLPAIVSAADIDRAVAAVVPALVPRWMTASELAGGLSTTGAAVRKPKLLEALAIMLDDGLVTRAFRFRCGHCGLATQVSLRLADDRVVCDGCTRVSTLNGPEGEPALVYGLNSLVDRAADQDCIGHLPVQQWITGHMDAVWSIPGADLSHASGATREIDILALSRQSLIVAEVKARHSAFDEAAVAYAVDIANRTVADHLVIAALDDWDPAAKADVVAAAQATSTGTVSAISLGDLQSA